jgi:phosphoserine aminotransferase
VTGHWGEKAAREAESLARVSIAATSVGGNYTSLPARVSWSLHPDAAYVHYTPNETIQGVEFHEVPEVGSVPLVADMSSSILSQPVDVSKFGVIYAGAQKNIGAAGLVVMIVREDLLARCPRELPKIFNYAEHAAQGSLLNTPNTFGWYLAGLVFKWLLAEGGLETVGARNRAKADLLTGILTVPVSTAIQSSRPRARA